MAANGRTGGGFMMDPASGGRGGACGEVVDVKSVFIGAGCNRVVNNVCWSPSGLVSFGAQNAVALFHPEDAQIWTTLPGHKAVVNCTQWLPSNKDAYQDKHYLLSGSADGVILLWEICLKEKKWRQVLQVPESHTKGVTCITGIFVSQGVALFASTCSDGTVLVWEMALPVDSGGRLYLLYLILVMWDEGGEAMRRHWTAAASGYLRGSVAALEDGTEVRWVEASPKRGGGLLSLCAREGGRRSVGVELV
ncbi:hypothetical protein Taro_035636 [Colocasia esculenta]|uniref:Elongator complex protein 2 n=1 Tax=Colocasia esculenta TaxID=4460 RepID=A0A843WDU0_COLES|nr:hypothetical protein [Colocasia esculenta]